MPQFTTFLAIYQLFLPFLPVFSFFLNVDFLNFPPIIFMYLPTIRFFELILHLLIINFPNCYNIIAKYNKSVTWQKIVIPILSCYE